MKITVNNNSTSLLTWTTAMACWSFSIPAGKEGACPMAVENDPNSICAHCYAMAHRYNFDNVMKSQFIRFEWVKNLLKTNPQEFIDTMSKAIIDNCVNKYFRLHDSGDFFSIQYINAWTEIAKKVAKHEVRIWAPTRAHRFHNWHSHLLHFSQQPNVNLRNSGIYFNEAAPVIENFPAGSAVINDASLNPAGHKVCPKSLTHTNCEEEKCRACWDDEKTPVSYIYHAYKISPKIKNKRVNFSKKFQQVTIGGK